MDGQICCISKTALPVAVWMQLKELAALVYRLQVATGRQALHREGYLPRLTVLPLLQHYLCQSRGKC